MPALLTVAAVTAAAWLLSRALRATGLPPVVGMVIGGAAAGGLAAPRLAGLELPSMGLEPDDLSRGIRLAILLLVLVRAGLGLTPADLRRGGPLALRLGLLPLAGDAAIAGLAAWWLLDLPPATAAVLGWTVACVSPAIVIPSLVDLSRRVRGLDRRVVTALLTGVPLDNIVGVAALGLVSSLVAGRAVGSLGPLVVLTVLAGGVALRARAPRLGARLDRLLARAWTVGQLLLFGLIGASVETAPLRDAGLALAAVIGLGQLGRLGGTLAATAPLALPPRYRLACAACYVPKATIQAAFGSLALDRGLAGGELVMAAAVLSIVLCAPLGVVTLQWAGQRVFGAREPVRSRPALAMVSHDPDAAT